MEKTTILVPITEIQTIARSVVASKLFAAFKDEPTALTLMMLAQAEGLLPIQAVQRYDIIQGKPAKKAAAMLADFMAAGGKIEYVHDTDECVEIIFHSPTLVKPISVRWDIEDAKRAKLDGKDTWRAYPNAMLTARCISTGIRKAMPAIVAGIYTPEEVADFEQPKVAAKPAPAAPAPATESPVSESQIGASVSPVPYVDAEIIAPPQPQAPPPRPSTPAQRSALIATLKKAGMEKKDQLGAWVKSHITRDAGGLGGCWYEEVEMLQRKANELVLQQQRDAVEADRKRDPLPDWDNREPPRSREPGEDG